MADPIPTLRESRARIERLDPDVRDHIVHEVRNGRELREREWAALAVVIARLRRRELLVTVFITPVLVFLVLLTGTVAGEWSRGADPWAAAHLVITWNDGLPWVAIAVGIVGLLLLATRRYRAKLRRAERLNRQRVRGG